MINNLDSKKYQKKSNKELYLILMQELVNDFYRNNKDSVEFENSFPNSNCKSSVLIQDIFEAIMKNDNLKFNFSNLQEGISIYLKNMKSLENFHGELLEKYSEKKYVKQRLRYHHYKSIEKIFKNLTTAFFSKKNYDSKMIQSFEDEVVSIFLSFFLILSIKDLKKKILNFRHNEQDFGESVPGVSFSSYRENRSREENESEFNVKKNSVDGSKYQLLSEFSRNIDSFFLLISHFFKEKINLSEGDTEFNGHLILFLSSESYIKEKSSSTSIKKKFSYNTTYML